MEDDPARYLAGRFSVLYAGETGSPTGDLTFACESRGVEMFTRPRLGARGYFTPWPFPAVILGPAASLRVRCHELAHAWLNDAIEYGIEYEPPTWNWDGDEEAAADRFAAYLAGGESDHLTTPQSRQGQGAR